MLAGLLCLARERRDDIVRFLTFHFDDGDAIGRQDLAHECELSAQIVGHCTPLRFILRIQRDAFRRHAFIEGRYYVGRLLVGDQLVEHHREAVNGIDRSSAARG